MTKREAAAEAQGPQAKKPKVAPSAAAASGGCEARAVAPAAVAPEPLSITQLLETERASTQQSYLAQWVRNTKNYVDKALHGLLAERKREISFALPEKCFLISPLAISQAAPGANANISAFREVMDYDNLTTSFARTGQYEAAGTVWMVDPISSDVDDVSVSQLGGAMGGMDRGGVPPLLQSPADAALLFRRASPSQGGRRQGGAAP